ncbi:type II secretion system protein [Pseudoteredinibacter isoporae]|uniref:type II secretion system protein n=1 Tax=Pseudoteredinibacter isoporae TaxID=570281 RepID=UPI003104F99A
MKTPVQRGFTLVELIVFIVLLAIVAGAFSLSFTQFNRDSIDPIEQHRALQCAKAKLETIALLRFSSSTPVGGLPACGSGQDDAQPCGAIVGSSVKDDIGDFDGETDTSFQACSISVSVTEGSGGLSVSGLASPGAQLRRIEVRATVGNSEVVLSSYKGNY